MLKVLLGTKTIKLLGSKLIIYLFIRIKCAILILYSKMVWDTLASQPIRSATKVKKISKVALVVLQLRSCSWLCARAFLYACRCIAPTLSFPSLLLALSLQFPGSRLWIAFSSPVLRESAGVFRNSSLY
jgi:hypothetical protein